MKWYYAEGGRQVGPVEESALDELVRQGVVRDDTLVWREGMSAWQRHGAVRGGSGAPAAPPPPPAASAASTGAAAAPSETRYCSECGRPYPASQLTSYGEASVCPQCQPAYIQGLKSGAGARHFGGFWIRLVARVIDWVLIGVVMCVIFVPVVLITGGVGAVSRDLAYGNRATPDSLQAIGVMWILGSICLAIVIPALYEIYFVSQRAATPGKLALGLKIIRADGGPITIGLATGRFFARILTSLIPLEIGYIIAGFDSQKRALHDYICSTRVVYAP